MNSEGKILFIGGFENNVFDGLGILFNSEPNQNELDEKSVIKNFDLL